MNRLLIFVASVSLAIVTISTTCLAEPAALANNVPRDGFVQTRALGIGPDYIAGFQRIGYGDLAVSTIV
jgi:hypothetical protein